MSRSVSALPQDRPREHARSPEVVRGAIVRHPDSPQWEHGFVIQARKTATDVFFQWGGRQRIPLDEPLQPVQGVGVRAEVFTLCAGLPVKSWSRGRHSIYAIELDPAVWKHRAFRDRNPGGADGVCLYVGATGLTPEERFERHKAGTQSGRFVGRYGRRLRLDLVEGFSRLPYRIAACMEPKVAAWLRAQGFGVWQN